MKTIDYSRFLIPEPPLFVLPSIAKTLGLNQAIILQQIFYWTLSSGHEIEGQIWVYNTYKGWAKQFPWLSPEAVKKNILQLEKEGYLITRMFNEGTGDRTKWYTIDIEKLNTDLPHEAKSNDGEAKSNDGEAKSNHLPILHTLTTETTPKIPRKGPGKPSEKDGIVSAMFTEMRAYLGYPERVPQDPIPNYGQEGIAIKRLLTRGYSSEEILKYWRERVDKAGGFVTMVYVNQDIGRPVPGKPGGNHRRQGAIPSEDELSRKAHQLGLPE